MGSPTAGVGRAMLVLKDPGGEPLDLLLGAPMEVARIAMALGKLHQRRLVHKDIKPANILVNSATGRCGLPGSASHRAFPASDRRLSLPRPSQAHSPIWTRSEGHAPNSAAAPQSRLDE